MTSLERQFTASAYIFCQGKILLLRHKKLGKWLPPGGHLEKGETPAECAIREVLEETGLHVEILSDEPVQIEDYNAKTIARPWLCLLENIPEYQSVPEHQHIDFIYLAKPVTPFQELPKGLFLHEKEELCWMTLEEVQALPKEDLFAETLQTLEAVFSQRISCIDSNLYSLARSSNSCLS